MQLILYIIMLCFYSATYSNSMLFGSLLCSRNAAHKYLTLMANSSIQIYLMYNRISLINQCLNYD